jgi:hypothetical protein
MSDIEYKSDSNEYDEYDDYDDGYYDGYYDGYDNGYDDLIFEEELKYDEHGEQNDDPVFDDEFEFKRMDNVISKVENVIKIFNEYIHKRNHFDLAKKYLTGISTDCISLIQEFTIEEIPEYLYADLIDNADNISYIFDLIPNKLHNLLIFIMLNNNITYSSMSYKFNEKTMVGHPHDYGIFTIANDSSGCNYALYGLLDILDYNYGYLADLDVSADEQYMQTYEFIYIDIYLHVVKDSLIEQLITKEKILTEFGWNEPCSCLCKNNYNKYYHIKTPRFTIDLIYDKHLGGCTNRYECNC